MDRADRIGQRKDFTVYRLVSKGTLEERHLERQRAKQSLADEVIGKDAAGFKDLTKEELVGLFRLDSGDQKEPWPRPAQPPREAVPWPDLEILIQSA